MLDAEGHLMESLDEAAADRLAPPTAVMRRGVDGVSVLEAGRGWKEGRRVPSRPHRVPFPIGDLELASGYGVSMGRSSCRSLA